VKPGLEIILKITEVCNINCSYCYFFNGADRSFELHPRHMGLPKARDVADFIRKAADKQEIQSARVILHGGEPLMLGKRKFVELCEALDISSYPVRAAIAMQTNATLLDDEWIEIFGRYGIDVGVSIDGPEDYHDEHRVDHRGRGTHAQTVAGVRLLMEAFRKGVIKSLGAICVADPGRDARRIYRHIVHELGFRFVSFLFPDGDWSTVEPGAAEAIGHFFGEAMDEWLADDDPGIHMRQFSSMLAFARSPVHRFGENREDIVIVGVSSDGTLAPDDSFRTTMPEVFRPENATLNVSTSSFSDFLRVYGDGPVPGLKASRPQACRSCRWFSHCGGGELGHRFSQADGAWRESVYCGALKRLYAQLEDYMLDNGVAPTQIEAAFPAPVAA
jgi:uncharacterized protein